MEDAYIGKFLDNRYEILEKIGTGGMAVVYKALCHRLNRFVAIKILKSDLAENPELRRRFHAESQAVAMLSHPNIVSVYDVSHSDNTDYIVMELIEGITLKQYINRKGVLNWKEALHFATQIVKALSHAHSRGIIHRDIKPQNIMILKDGSVKVADFGIARLLSTENTLTQEALGSVHYISPEQAKGSPADARSDLYSVGVVMYEMLTNRLPFEGDSAVSIAIQHISSIPVMPRELNPEIPVGLEEITMRAMNPNLDLRYASADDMLADLEEFRKNPSVVFNYDELALLSPKPTGEEGSQFAESEAAREKTPRKNNGNGLSRDHTSSEEYRKNRRRANRTTVLVGLLCVALVLILLFLFMWNYFLKDLFNPTTEYISIPNFVGKYAEDVLKDTAYAQYFNFKIVEDTSDTYAEGQVMFQSPAAERQMTVLDNGIDVTLTVSTGENVVYMPDLINKDYRNAQLLLESYQLNLDIKTTGAPDESITIGYVTDQYPEEGERLFEGATVYITYSTGPDIVLVKVPPVTGLSKSMAISRLMSYDLSYDVKEVYSDTVENGIVVFQSYDAGEEIPIHTLVTIQVSIGPEPVTNTPPVTPTPDPVDTPEPTPDPTPTDPVDTPEPGGGEDEPIGPVG